MGHTLPVPLGLSPSQGLPTGASGALSIVTETLRLQAWGKGPDDHKTNWRVWLEECVPGQGDPETCPGPLGAGNRKWNGSFPCSVTSELGLNGGVCAAGLCRVGPGRALLGTALASEGLTCKCSPNLNHRRKPLGLLFQGLGRRL